MWLVDQTQLIRIIGFIDRWRPFGCVVNILTYFRFGFSELFLRGLETLARYQSWRIAKSCRLFYFSINCTLLFTILLFAEIDERDILRSDNCVSDGRKFVYSLRSLGSESLGLIKEQIKIQSLHSSPESSPRAPKRISHNKNIECSGRSFRDIWSQVGAEEDENRPLNIPHSSIIVHDFPTRVKGTTLYKVHWI